MRSDCERIAPKIRGSSAKSPSGCTTRQRFFAERRSPLRVPPPARIEAVGTDVLVRFRSPPGAPPLWSVYQFETGRLFRAVSFDNEAEAVRQTG